ncbi:Small ribosomal subunit protein uS9c-like protein [Drosera capensis]
MKLDLSDYVKERPPGGFAAQWKCAIARVVLLEWNGKVIINNRSAREYLQDHPLWVKYVRAALKILRLETSVDVFVKAHGGSLSGQAQAICLGVARALLKVNANYRKALKVYSLLTRDSRVVERKKAGLKQARKAPQYSKRIGSRGANGPAWSMKRLGLARPS